MTELMFQFYPTAFGHGTGRQAELFAPMPVDYVGDVATRPRSDASDYERKRYESRSEMAVETRSPFDPELRFGEAYMDGSVVVEEGSIADVLGVILRQRRAQRHVSHRRRPPNLGVAEGHELIDADPCTVCILEPIEKSNSRWLRDHTDRARRLAATRPRHRMPTRLEHASPAKPGKVLLPGKFCIPLFRA